MAGWLRTESVGRAWLGSRCLYFNVQPVIHLEGLRSAVETVSVRNCISHDSQYLLYLIASIATLANLFITMRGG
jgi:hypothetical protein